MSSGSTNLLLIKRIFSTEGSKLLWYFYSEWDVKSVADNNTGNFLGLMWASQYSVS